MKFRPSWRFWMNVICCLLNLWMFVVSGSLFTFAFSVVCCFFALVAWKADHIMFDFQQEKLKRSFNKQKKEEDTDVDF